MPEFNLVKTHREEIRGMTEADEKKHQKFLAMQEALEPGEFFQLTYKSQRNPGHHRKFMALVTYIAENSDTYDNKEKALVAVKLAAGHCDWVADPKGGGLIPIPKSISFDNMDQGDFDEFYNNAVQGTITHLLPHMTRTSMDEVLRHVSEF